MKLRVIIPVIAAIVLSAVAIRMGKGLLRQRFAVDSAALEGKVVMLTTDRPVGYALTAADLELRDAPQSMMTASTVRDATKPVGRILAAPVVKGQMLLETLMAPEGASAPLQALVPAGKRAVTVEINEVSGIAGLIAPGCHVDVVATLIDDQTRQTRARTIVQDVKVSAIGQNMQTGAKRLSDDGKKLVEQVSKTATLIVTPEQAERLDLAATKTKLRLVLRGAADDSEVTTSGVTLRELAGGHDDGAASAPRGPTMEELIAKHVNAALPASPSVAANAGPVVAAGSGSWKVAIVRGGVESVAEFPIAATPDDEVKAIESGVQTARERSPLSPKITAQ